MNEWNAWEKEQEKKSREKEAQIWAARFAAASGNNQEWQEVYKEYLQSAIWKGIRENALARANYKCQGPGCKKIQLPAKDLDIHHISYDRVGGFEKDEDLMVLCASCHRKANQKRDRNTARVAEESYQRACYENELARYATARYGKNWECREDTDEVEQEFIEAHCKRKEKDIRKYYYCATPYDIWEEIQTMEELGE